MHWQVKTCDYLQMSIPMMFWKMVAKKTCMVVCKPNGLDDIKCTWKLDDEPQCTFQISIVEGTFNYGHFATHSLEHFAKGESYGLSTLQLSNIIIGFLPPNVMSVVQPLECGIISSFRVHYKNKFL